MKKLLPILLVLVVLNTRAQTSLSIINTVKTAQHINIPGTRLFIVPPVGFTKASAFLGLQKGESSAMVVYDMDGGNYYSNASNFTKKQFESKGATVYEFKEIKVNKLPGRYAHISGDANGKAIALVFGDTTFSTMVMATYSAADEKTGEDIKKALATIYYDKAFKVDPFASATFTLDDSKSKLKFSQSTSGIFIYTLNGTAQGRDSREPMLTVITMPRDVSMDAKTISDMFTAKMEEQGMSKKEVKKTSTAPVNGLEAYEVEMDATMEAQVSHIYQLVVTGKDKAVVLEGLYMDDPANNLREMKSLARSIKLK